MLDKSKVDTELARRFCAAFVSYQLGIGIATQYKKTPEEVGDLWYFLAALAEKLAREGPRCALRQAGSFCNEADSVSTCRSNAKTGLNKGKAAAPAGSACTHFRCVVPDNRAPGTFRY